MKTKLLVMCSILALHVNAQEGKITHIEEEPRLPSSLNYSKYWLDLASKENTEKIDTVYEKDIEVTKKFEYLEGFEMSNRPKQVVLNSTMFIKAHPMYPFSLILPDGYTINDIHSFDQKDVSWKYDKNIVDLKAMATLSQQTLMIKYADRQGRKYATNLVVDRYTKGHGQVHNIYEAIQPKHLSVTEVLDMYYKKYGNFPQKTTYVTIEGVAYHFLEHRDGTLDLDGKKFFFKYGNE